MLDIKIKQFESYPFGKWPCASFLFNSSHFLIDETSTKLEVMAASTIAQHGIQLVAPAHGVTIKNLIMNPSLEMLLGGIQC
ncbi:Uncharacterized protein ycf45 [Camellia lanceoleosa]|uniref:Uncharacterized protein ycf45 n=1 Tax=Camellia lanceoleosa TaxID=1840588 RepID=A0ACC0I497_9ERIC|nr:Uncharacterized protein ycf45 [Camellia lanceoleosa]